jgi:hypothetical protein
MAETWDELAAAIAECASAYAGLLASRAENREGSKKAIKAEDRWRDAVVARAVAAGKHWTEEDGYIGEFKAMAPVIQRYYAETRLPYEKKGKR